MKIILPNEQEILSALSTGDELAFRQIFNHYWKNIYSVAFDFTKSDVIAEEIVQDVFLKIWLKREDLNVIERFDNYLFTVARNHIYNVLRKKSFEPLFVDHIENYFAESKDSPEEDLLLKESRELVQAAVDTLPNQQKIIFILSRYEGLDHLQISERLGISKLTVKSHMNRALHTIRSFLQSRSNGDIIYFLFVLFTISARK